MTRGSNHNVFSMASLDMSLDEIQNASTSNRGIGRGRGRGVGRGRGFNNRGNNRGLNSRGHIRRGRSDGSGGQFRGRGRGTTSNLDNAMNNYRRTTVSSSIRGQSIKRGSTTSRRGMGRGMGMGMGRGRGSSSGSVRSGGVARNPTNIETTGKVIVQNLGSHVTSDDVKEIFEKIGTITQAFVKFDKNGKSTGTAEVVYARKDDARKAQRDLNGAHVDGISIDVTLASQSPSIFHNGPSRGRSQYSNKTNNTSQRGRFGGSRDNNNYNFNNQGHHPLDRLYNK